MDCRVYDWTAADTEGKVLAEYIWLGGTGSDLRSKTVVLDNKPINIESLPIIDVDGSSCGQAVDENCEIYLKPRKLFCDPFRGADHVLVLCDTFVPPLFSGEVNLGALRPHSSNNRVPCEAVMKQAACSAPYLAAEQEFLMLDPQGAWPMGWPAAGLPDPTKSSYGATGTGAVVGREFAEEHVRRCMKAGLSVTAFNSTQVAGMWSYKLGPCPALDFADELWTSRYILLRVSEQFGTAVSLDPKPVPGDWSGVGCCLHFSTAETRQEGVGILAIQEQVGRLESNHPHFIMACGHGNIKRLVSKTNVHGTKFSCGIGDKRSSVMIPRVTVANRAGCYIDRRPAANMDPYLVSMLLVSVACGVPLPTSAKSTESPSLCRVTPMHSSQHPSGSISGFSRSLNTEDVLISELDKYDQKFSPNTPDKEFFLMGYESSDECSDGTSPERDSPLRDACDEDDMF